MSATDRLLRKRHFFSVFSGVYRGIGSQNNQHSFGRAWCQSSQPILPRSPSDAETSVSAQ